MNPFQGTGTRVGGAARGSLRVGATGLRGGAPNYGAPTMGRGRVDLVARGMGAPLRKPAARTSPRRAAPGPASMFSFAQAANAMGGAGPPANLLQRAAPQRPAPKRTPAAAQPKSLPAAKRKLDDLIMTYQMLDTVDLNDPAQRSRLVRSISEGDWETFTLMTNGLNPGQRVSDVVAKDPASGDPLSIFKLAIDTLNEGDHESSSLKILERLIDIRYPLQKEYGD